MVLRGKNKNHPTKTSSKALGAEQKQNTGAAPGVPGFDLQAGCAGRRDLGWEPLISTSQDALFQRDGGIFFWVICGRVGFSMVFFFFVFLIEFFSPVKKNPTFPAMGCFAAISSDDEVQSS